MKKTRFDLPLSDEYISLLDEIKQKTGTKRYSDTIRICIQAYPGLQKRNERLLEENKKLKEDLNEVKNILDNLDKAIFAYKDERSEEIIK